jgi:hypothetical protein
MRDPAVEQRREVRRIFLVALVAAAAAGVLALLLSLRGADDPQPAAAAVDGPAFPATFGEPGFVEGPVRLVADAAAGAGVRRLAHAFDVPGGPVWVVAQCDTGTVTVRTGAVSSGRPCTGAPVGVAALGGEVAGGALDVVVTVSAAQDQPWGVAVYR